MKIGERYNSLSIRNIERTITAIGKKLFLAESKDGVEFSYHYKVLLKWTKTHEADGTPVGTASKGDERVQLYMVHQGNNGAQLLFKFEGTALPMNAAGGLANFIAVEDLCGNLYGHFIKTDVDDAGQEFVSNYRTRLSRTQWESGEWKVPTYTAVVLGEGEGNELEVNDN